MFAGTMHVDEVNTDTSLVSRWLPRLAPLLPLAIPVPPGKGTPADDYPWCWSVYRWLDGQDATAGPVADPHRAATELGRFVVALQRIDSDDGSCPGEHNFLRGAPLAERNASTRTAITALDDIIESGATIQAWEAVLQAPAWDRPPVWIHGDLLAGNLLTRQGRLSAVVDFGCLGVETPRVT